MIQPGKARLRTLGPSRALVTRLALALVPVLAGACNATGTPLNELAEEINSTYEAERMGILPGDELRIEFTERSDWDHDTLVRPDGTASFLHLGVVRVGGLSVEALNAQLTAAYAETFQQHELAVFVTTAGGRTVAVLGAVEDPQLFPMPGGRMTLLDALANAGGVSERFANLKDVHLVRWSPSQQRQLSWHIDARTDYWADAAPVLLQPYDLIYVPLKTIVHVNIWIDQYIRLMIPFPYLIPPIGY